VSSRIIFNLNISSQEYLTYYQGAVKHVIVRAHDGRKVQFPAAWLRQFVTREGVRGEFEIVHDAQHKLQSMRRLR